MAVHSTANIAKGVIRDALEGKDLKESLRDQTTNAAMDLKHHAEKQAGKILGVKRGMSQESNTKKKKKMRRRRKKTNVSIPLPVIQNLFFSKINKKVMTINNE